MSYGKKGDSFLEKQIIGGKLPTSTKRGWQCMTWRNNITEWTNLPVVDCWGDCKDGWRQDKIEFNVLFQKSFLNSFHFGMVYHRLRAVFQMLGSPPPLGCLMQVNWTCFRIRCRRLYVKNDHFPHHTASASSKMNHCIVSIDVDDDWVHSSHRLL
jgi:hypothetical protein